MTAEAVTVALQHGLLKLDQHGHDLTRMQFARPRSLLAITQLLPAAVRFQGLPKVIDMAVLMGYEP